MGPIEKQIRDILSQALNPVRMEVINESHMHAGHAGGSADGSGETHMRVRVISAKFDGVGRVQRHRLINDLLKPVLDEGLHALALEPAATTDNVRW
ncbi:BolA family protein [Ahrensia kielensis]|uniref:BolA family protein n=1 Tax=Ahrensia kielensis TaxID=76980 RepID=UPI00039B67EC|nr:BolA family protein [Ahrensia kielensis]